MLSSHCMVVKANARPAAQRAVRATPRVVVVNAVKQQSERPTATYRTQLAAGIAAAALILSQQPAFAALESLTGPPNTPDNQIGKQILKDDIPQVDSATAAQPYDGVKQGIDEAKQVVVEQAKELVNDPPGTTKGYDGKKDKATGLQSQLAQLKSMVGL